ncbi:hypothetical protein F5Y15DRAFT_129586 [Xylariaceae sp. FL0016]|nr:hypothetical protein F5Y15DRAFT_129586 [Xylariaceae sp. FL0016]
MAVIKDMYVSDDEFDVVEAADPVSDLSSPAEPGVGEQNDHFDRQYATAPGNRRLSSMQYHDRTVNDAARRLAESTLGDSFVSTPSWNTRDMEPAADGDGSSALKYTKSVVERFWSGRDLLIAVMGYV